MHQVWPKFITTVDKPILRLFVTFVNFNKINVRELLPNCKTYSSYVIVLFFNILSKGEYVYFQQKRDSAMLYAIRMIVIDMKTRESLKTTTRMVNNENGRRLLLHSR